MGPKGHTSLAEGCGLPSKYSWLALSCLVYIPISIYDGIGRNVCHEESFLQLAILPTFAEAVCSVSPQDM